MTSDETRPDHFSGDVAARYDETSPTDADELARTVGVLADLAADGPALEFAIGTGRVALPLAAQGVPVHGIELSPDMVDRLRTKPGGDLPVVLGDMTTAVAPGAGTFSLVYLVYNGIGNLTSQDDQVTCFANAAAHLAPGGHFLIENVVPALRRLPPGDDAHVFAHAPGYVGYDRYTDLVAQQAVSHHFVVDAEGGREVRTPWRFAWPSELDLMARLAGLTFRSRWAGWDRSPFTATSPSHVSVWTRPA